MNYKQLQPGDIVAYCTLTGDIMPLVIDFCDTPEHAVTHNHISVKHLQEICGASIDRMYDIKVDVRFLECNKWDQELIVYKLDAFRTISWERKVEEDSYHYEFRIHNKVWNGDYQGEPITVRRLQHIMRDLDMTDWSDNLMLPDVEILEKIYMPGM